MHVPLLFQPINMYPLKEELVKKCAAKDQRVNESRRSYVNK